MFETGYLKWPNCVSVLFIVASSSSISATNISTIAPVLNSVNATRNLTDLSDMGFNGTWEEFCDSKKLEKDFTLYPEHDIKVMRSMLCILKARNRIIGKARIPLAIYKYCVTIQSQLDGFMEKFLSILATDNDDRRTILMVPGSQNDTSSCYTETFAVFTESCATNGNPCVNMFRSLLSRACTVPWLTTADIISTVHEVCDGKFITDKVNWETILRA